MKTLEDFIDDIDKIRHENANEFAYHRGKAVGYKTATDIAYKAKTLEILEDNLYSYRQQLIQDKEDLEYNDNATEEDRRFVCGELDGIDEAKDLLLDKKGKYMKVYLVKVNYSGWEDPESNGSDVKVFDTKEKALEYMPKAVKEEIADGKKYGREFIELYSSADTVCLTSQYPEYIDFEVIEKEVL